MLSKILIVVFIILGLFFICLNGIKNIRRRHFIKKMKVDNRIEGLIEDFKNEINNDEEMKLNHKKDGFGSLFLKLNIYEKFIKRIDNVNVKWNDKLKSVDLDNEYKTASFNVIDKSIEDKVGFDSILLDYEFMRFEDGHSFSYKDKSDVVITDFVLKKKSKLPVSKTYWRNFKQGVFTVVKTNKNINNNIRITNDKVESFLSGKEYTITTLPKEFNDKFSFKAKDGVDLINKISKRSIELIEEFYDNTKMIFDISIMGNSIYFRFNTIDMLEMKDKKNLIDDLMLKEYANIFMFILNIVDEIIENWDGEIINN